MKAECIAERPSARQASLLEGIYDPIRQTYNVRRGQVYLVYGLSVWRGLVWLEVADEYEQVSSVPLFLFTIVDSTVPSNWILRVEEDVVRLWPEEFHREGFHVDLLESQPEALDAFRLVRRQMEG